MWIVIGFATLGFLIGNLVGLTAHSVVTSVLTLIFASTGGSVIAFLGKLGPDDRRIAGQMIFSLSLCCVLGTYTGIAVSEWHLLSPQQRASTPIAAAVSPPATSSEKTGNCEVIALKNKYLDYLPVSKVNDIDWKYRHSILQPKDAYEQLYLVLNSSPQTEVKRKDDANR